jgi:hypothetical protein
MHNRSGIILIICRLPFYGFYRSVIPYALLVFLLMKLFYYVCMVFIDKQFCVCSWCVFLVFSSMKMKLYLLPSSVRHAAGRLLGMLVLFSSMPNKMKKSDFMPNKTNKPK